MYLFENLNRQIQQYLPEEQIMLLRQAYAVANKAHKDQTRSSGEPYITHPVAVACILASMRLDYETLMAALLHDVIEDTVITYQDIVDQFGKSIAELVDGVSKLDKLKFRDKKEAQAENFRKMIMAMVQDIRVILIKLADRTHNMRTLDALRPDKRRRIARETLEIYSPLAHRLGIHHLKTELEDLGFKALYPNRYRVIKKVIRAARGNRKEIIQKILAEIEGRLTEMGIACQVSGREKHPYSIYRKMRHKERRFHSIMDIYAFRVIVDDIDTCYRVLGQIHSLYKPRPNRMKDYIAIPKANGYQSLHTSLIGPHGVPVEVQVRTADMEQMAEMGVAAHWVYKAKERIESGTAAQIRAQRWMQSLLELQQSTGNSFEFIEGVKTDLFPDEIYVFTPKGRIIELPTGATSIDFAYAVHTDIGHACVGARVDHQPFPLSKPLSNGQTVEVITSPGARPNAAWLNFAVTSKARAKIRQILKSLKREDSINLGRRLLNHALGGMGKVADTPPENLERLLKRVKMSSLDDLLAEIGLGNTMSLMVAKYLQDDNNSHLQVVNGKLAIRGADGVMLTCAKCCRPIPGDPIIAHINPGKGLVIHYEFCHNVRHHQREPEKFVAVQWEKNTSQDFLTEIRVEMFNHHGSLANLTAMINSTNSDIHSLNTEEKDGRIYNVFILLMVEDRLHLANIMRKIRIMPDVIKVHRSRS